MGYSIRRFCDVLLVDNFIPMIADYRRFAMSIAGSVVDMISISKYLSLECS